MEGTKTQLNLSNYLINDKQNQISFFKHGYKNYKNFAKETRKITFENSFDFGNRTVIDLNKSGRYGDYVTNVSLEVELPDLSGASIGSKGVGYCNGIGHALIESMELKIGGHLIDRHSDMWADFAGELFIGSGTQSVYNDSIKKYADTNYIWNNFQGGTIIIPLHFWFCNYGSGSNNTFILPLAALYNTTIEFIFKLRGINDLIRIQDDGVGNLTSTSYSITSASLIVDYIILEEEAREILLEKDITMPFIITQIQEHKFEIEASATSKVVTTKELRYPVSELLWAIRRNDAITNNEYFKYGDTLSSITNNPILRMSIKFEGKDRLPELSGDYFSKLEPLKVHNTYPVGRHLHCYSFGIDPENFAQPSGVCNFSDLHTVQFPITLRSGLASSMLHMFAINYNVLQVRNGTACLLHALSKSSPGQANI